MTYFEQLDIHVYLILPLSNWVITPAQLSFHCCQHSVFLKMFIIAMYWLLFAKLLFSNFLLSIKHTVQLGSLTKDNF